MARSIAICQSVVVQPRVGLWGKTKSAVSDLPFGNLVQMMSPTAPLVNKQLIWHLYSAQAYGVRCSFLPTPFIALTSCTDLPR